MGVVNSITITEEVTDITVNNTNGISIDLVTEDTSVTVNNVALPAISVDATNVSFTPYNTINATTVYDALKQLADQDFRSDSAPTGANVSEGDTWYDTDDDHLKVYRETSSGTFEWVPIMIGNISDDSDTVDAGAF